MENFQEILELKKEDDRTYIDSKIKTFEKCRFFCPTGSSAKMNKTKKFFWGEDSEIITGYAPLIVDDKEIFEFLFENVKNEFKESPKNYRDYKKTLFRCVQKTVFDYLGIGRPGLGQREHILRTIYEMDQKCSIRNFKGSCYGECTERAVIAHECFKMLGFESVLATEHIYIDNAKMFHAFNFVKIEGRTYLYDLINTYCTEVAPPPRISSCEVENKDLVKQIYDDSSECELFEYELETKSQGGKRYTINYGSPEIEHGLS